jgi:solute carrier family 13 (sodium-dependent dicarboxylate transporter), member 2/3/5
MISEHPERVKGEHAGLKTFFAAAAIAAGVAITGFLLTATDWPREAAFMSGIFVFAALLWVTEAIPLFATALAVIGLQALLLANPGEWPGLGFESGKGPEFRAVFQAAADPVLVLFLGGFLLARAAVKEGLDQAMSSLLLRPFGGRPVWVMLGIMIVTAAFSMWMSNTATTAMMIALVAPMLAQLPPGESIRKGIVLAVPFAANIGGMGTPISSPPNAVAVGFLRKAGYSVSFLDWMLVAVPLLIGLLLFAWVLLCWFYPASKSGLAIVPQTSRLTGRAWVVFAVFVLTVLLWISDRWHGIPPALVALVPAVLLTATRLLDRHDVNGIDWNVLILIAGGISLGAGMQMSGLDQIIAEKLPGGEGGGTWTLAALVTATLVFGTFMSNTAIANLLLPIGISAATAFGPGQPGVVQVAMSIALTASVSMALPVSTPPNAIAYARGEVRTRDMARGGVIIGIVALLLVVAFGGRVMRFWGIG